MRLPVEKYDVVGAPETVAAARWIAGSIALLLVASPLVWKTTTFGARAPAPNASSVRWLASYAGLPGIAKLWYQRVATCPAAKPPKTVRASQVPITVQRCRTVRRARRASMDRRIRCGA